MAQDSEKLRFPVWSYELTVITQCSVITVR